ncbi:hypothetical protein AHF37_08092 [Paragonimus kellicotti]|nr:hypothetical protein AHF37_08092 [Paragonimus kellicotti]
MHGVAHLTNLTILNLPNNGIVAIDGLAKLTQLRWLNLSANRLRSADQLEGNVNLKHLDVSENYIGQLSDISYLPRLKTFLLHCNRIQTLANAGRLLPRSLEIFSLASNLVGSLADVQQLTMLPNLVQFSLQNNPCTTFPPEDYEPLILAQLPKLQILNGINVQPEMRARAQRLQENKESLNAFVISTASQRSPAVALTPPRPDLPPLSVTPPVHLPPSPDSVTSGAVSTMSDHLQNPTVDGSQVVSVTEDTVERPNHNQVKSIPNFGPVTPKQSTPSTRETDTTEANKSTGEHQSASCISMATEHNDLPAMSFRAIFAEKSATNPMNDFKFSPIRQRPQPTVIQGLPPTDVYANSPPHLPQGSENSFSNPAACSLLMSESVYLPVSSSLSPTDQCLNLSSDPQATSVPSSVAGTPQSFPQYLPRSVRSGPSSAASGGSRFQPSTSALSDSLDVITSHDLDSSRTTTVLDGNGLRQTLQSSVSLIPLNNLYFVEYSLIFSRENSQFVFFPVFQSSFIQFEDTTEANKSTGEHQSASCISMATEHNDLPAMSFRAIFAEKSATNPMNDFKFSPIRQRPQPTVIQGLPPTDVYANSPPHLPQGSENSFSNPAACSLLMSESVYLPVSSSLSPTDQCLNLSSDPQATSVPSSVAGTPQSFPQYLPRSVRSGPSSAASGGSRFQPSTSALSDSLDVITSHDLDSSRTTTVLDGNGLRQTLQSSVSLIPLNKSNDSVEATSVCTHTPRGLSTVPFSNDTIHRLTTVHPTKMIDSVHLLNDEEDNEERAASHLNVGFHSEGLTDRIPSHMTRSYPTDPATSGLGNSSNSVRLSAPSHSDQTATPTDRIRLDQLLLRSHPMQGETVARSLDSWMKSSVPCSPGNVQLLKQTPRKFRRTHLVYC